MARGDAAVQPYQFDPESDPEGEAPPDSVAAAGHFRMLVCLNNVSLFICVVTVTTM